MIVLPGWAFGPGDGDGPSEEKHMNQHHLVGLAFWYRNEGPR